MDSTLLSGLIGAGAVLIGIAVSEALAVRRRRIEREENRRLLAGSLAAEIRGLMVRWREIAPPDMKLPVGPVLAMFSVEESYFTVYEATADRLCLLPYDVALDVAMLYQKAKVTLDGMRIVSRLSDSVRGQNPKVLSDPMNQAVLRSLAETGEYTRQYGGQAAALADTLVPKLEAIATGKKGNTKDGK